MHTEKQNKQTSKRKEKKHILNENCCYCYGGSQNRNNHLYKCTLFKWNTVGHVESIVKSYFENDNTFLPDVSITIKMPPSSSTSS